MRRRGLGGGKKSSLGQYLVCGMETSPRHIFHGAKENFDTSLFLIVKSNDGELFGCGGLSLLHYLCTFTAIQFIFVVTVNNKLFRMRNISLSLSSTTKIII